MSNIQEKAVLAQDRIIKEKYYDDLWHKLLKRCNMSVASINAREHSDRDLIFLYHDFWESLPDSPMVRKGPFFEVCDIAEHIFD